jgi:hypothetical protein
VTVRCRSSPALMARRTAVRPALTSVSYSSVLLDSCPPSDNLRVLRPEESGRSNLAEPTKLTLSAG